MLSLKVRRCRLQAAASLFVFTALVLGALAGCPQDEEKNADTPSLPVTLSGQITVFGTPTGTGFVVNVYDYSAVIENADNLKAVTALLPPVATGLALSVDSSISTVTLEIAETVDADFTFDGAFLVVINAASSDSDLTRFQSAVSFASGAAILVYENMQGDSKQEEPVPDVYTVTFDLNYFTDDGVVNPILKEEVAVGGTAKLPSTPQALAGYIFGGWFLNKAGTGEAWNFANAVTGNITLYAHWTQNMFTVRFDLAYFDAPAPEEQKVVVGGFAFTPTPAPTRDGYDFGGWFKELTEAGEAWNFAIAVPGNITLYAKWIPIKYTVSFSTTLPTGAIGPAVGAQTVAYGGRATRPVPDPTTLAGYTFGGWYADAQLTEPPFDFNTVITRNTVVHAKWTPTTSTP